MALIGKFLLAGVVGLIIGLGLTFAALQNGFGFGLGAVKAGPWTTWPKTGTGDPDPYTRAMLAHSGEIPLGASEGISFVADGDSAGRRFDAACDYKVSGQTPRARFWTLTVMTPGGQLETNPAGRNGFTSREILRALDGAFVIALSRHARSGNWLPLGGGENFLLILRLYEPEFSVSTLAFDAASLPAIERGACR